MQPEVPYRIISNAKNSLLVSKEMMANQGGRVPRAPVQFLSFSCSFGKNWPNISLAPLLWGWRSLLGNPGSGTGYYKKTFENLN